MAFEAEMTTIVLPSQTVIKRIGTLVCILVLAAVILIATACRSLDEDGSAKSTPTLTPVATASPAPTGTPIPTLTPGGFLYAREAALKEIPSEEVTFDRYLHVYDLFLTDSQGANPYPLFRIRGASSHMIGGSGTWSLIRQWHLLLEEKAILVNLESELVRYDLKTGQPTSVYTVEEDSWEILGFALSHDRRSIALTLADTSRNLEDSLLVILEYRAETGRTNVTAEVPHKGHHVPVVWSSDDQLIFYQWLTYRGGSNYLWASSRDVSDLHKLSALSFGILSLGGRWYAYADGQVPPWPWPELPRSVISLLNLATGTTFSIVDQEHADQWFILRAWSPDGSQLLYSSRDSNWDSSSPPPSLYEESNTEVSYLYDLSTETNHQIPSWREQQRTWLEQVPACARRFNILESVEAFPYCGGDLIIQGQVVDSGHLIYIGRLPDLE